MRSVGSLAVPMAVAVAAATAVSGLGGCKSLKPRIEPVCEEQDHRCLGDVWQVCSHGQWTVEQVCALPTPLCSESQGCYTIDCQPGETFCDGDRVRLCDADGNPGEVLEVCDGSAHEFCASGECTDPCRQAAGVRSYVGCEYFPTPTVNSSLDYNFGDNFAVVAHNANDATAVVEVWRRSIFGLNEEQLIADGVVGPGQLGVFELQLDTGVARAGSSSAVPGAAYRLQSDLPVTVYQFNPLDYEKIIEAPWGEELHTYSQTNDAALLLPTHALSGNYLVMARASFGVASPQTGGQWMFKPGFVAVAAVQNDTTVTFTSSSHTLAGALQGGTPLEELRPGGLRTFNLDAGDVLQVLSKTPDTLDCASGISVTDDCNGLYGGTESCTYCDLGPEFDLTGSRIEASAPVAVFSGHACAFVPYDVWACDHLEEQLLPLESWGKQYVVGRTEPQSPAGPEPNLVRVLSGEDGNVITLDPPQSIGGTVALDQGEWAEFGADGDVHVSATGATLVGQFMVGQNYNTPETDHLGDPSFALMVPVEQYRTAYTFLAPATFQVDFVNVIRPGGAQGPEIILDGAPVDRGLFGDAVGSSDYRVARVPIEGTGHTVTSTAPFGIVVYGFARYTSYLYPDGLDLEVINPVR